MTKFLLLALAAGLAYAAYAQLDNTTISKPNSRDLSDGEIAKALLTVNEGEVAAAKEAQSHSNSSEIKAFAEAMIEQHTANDKVTDEIADENKIQPTESDLSRRLQKEATRLNQWLVKAPNFDQAYVKEQIKMHEDALQTLDDVLIPSSQNPKLRQHLQTTRVAVADHLSHARRLQAQFR